MSGQTPGAHDSPHSTRRRGGRSIALAPTSAFTLIEVLVVVAIIALLVAVLLPTLAHARERGRVAVCASNQRTSGDAIYYYTQASAGVYPSSGAWAEHVRTYLQRGGAKGRSGGSSSQAGIDYHVEFYICPSDKELARTGELFKQIGGEIVKTKHRVSYVVNVHLLWKLKDPSAARQARSDEDYEVLEEADRLVRDEKGSHLDPLGNPMWTNMRNVSQVKRVHDIVLLADGGDDEVDTYSAYWDFDDKWDRAGFKERALEVHHRTGNNFLFADRHVEYRRVVDGEPRRGVPRVPWHWIPLRGIPPTADDTPPFEPY